MNKRNDFMEWVAVIGMGVAIAAGGIFLHRQHKAAPAPTMEMPLPRVEVQPPAPQPEAPKAPKTPTISTAVPGFMQYTGVVDQIKKWNQEAADLTEVGTYGKSKRGTDLYYIRVTNKMDPQTKPVVLVHACIHGNEPHSTTSVMAYIGTMLSTYGKDEEVTQLINSRDFYFVPVMCTDSYPHSRHIDGVDPNRDYPHPGKPGHKSTPCVNAMQEFFMKIKPKAVISGHTFGRIYLTPWGDQMQKCPNEADYQRIVGKMAQMSQYKLDRACNMYNRPIYGGELDWYYRRGAMSVVIEYGTHQRAPSQQEIQSEFHRTYKSVLHFFQEAPKVQISSQWMEPQPIRAFDLYWDFLPEGKRIHLPLHIEGLSEEAEFLRVKK